MSSVNHLPEAIDDESGFRGPAYYGKKNRALPHAMAKFQEAQTVLRKPSAFPALMGMDYLSLLKGEDPGGARLRRSTHVVPRNVQKMVDQVETIFSTHATGPALLAAIDFEDLEWLVDEVGLEAFPAIQDQLEQTMSQRHVQEKEWARANYLYEEAMERRRFLETYVGTDRDLGKGGFAGFRPDPAALEGVPLPEDPEAITVEGFTFRPEDLEQAVRERLGLDDDLSDVSNPDYFMQGMGVGIAARDKETAPLRRSERSNMEADIIEDIMSNDSWIGKKLWDLAAFRGGQVFQGVGEFITRAGAGLNLILNADDAIRSAINGVDPADPGSLEAYADSVLAVRGSGALREARVPISHSPEMEQMMNHTESLRTETGEKAFKKYARQNWLPNEAQAYVMENEPEQWAAVVEKYGLEFATMGFNMEFEFGANTVAIEEQLEDMYQFELGRRQALHTQMEETNFMAASPVMSFLTSWGRWVDSVGAASIGFFQQLGDNEEATMLQELRAGTFAEDMAVAMEEGNHTPAGMLGLDGTFLGLMVNMGMGIIFDPTNWLIGPVGRGVGITGRNAVKTALTTPSMKMLVREMTRLGPNVLASAQSRSLLFRPFAEVDMVDEAYAAVGLADQVIPQGDYIHSSFGKVSHVVDLEFVEKVLGGEQLSQLDNLSEQTVTQLGNSLKNKGFNEPILLTLDRTTGSLRVSDGLKRMKAAKEIGATKVPVAIKVEGTPIPEGAQNALEPAFAPDDPIFTTVHTLDPQDVFQATLPGEVETLRRTFRETSEPGSFAPLEAGGPAKGPDAFRLSVEDSGIREPLVLVVDDLGHVKLKDGNHRLAAALEMGLDSVPVRLEPFSGVSAQIFDTISQPTVWRLLNLERPSVTPLGVLVDDLGGKVPTNLHPHLQWIEDGRAQGIHPTALFDLPTMGTTANPAMVEALMEKALLAGADIFAANQGWLHTGMGMMARRLFETGAMRPFSRLFRAVNNSTTMSVVGPGGAKNLYRLVEFLGAPDPKWMNHWMQRIMQNQKANGVRRLAEMKVNTTLRRMQKLDSDLAAKQMAQSPWDPKAVATWGDEALRTAKNIDEARTALRRMMADERRRMATEIDRMAPSVVSWQDMVDEMLADYVNEFALDSWNDGPIPLYTPDGVINWHVARRGHPGNQAARKSRGQAINEMKNDAAEARRRANIPLDPNLNVTTTGDELLSMFQDLGNDIVEMPLTPLELAGLSTKSGSRYTRLTQRAGFDAFRHFIFKADALWSAAVLLTPRVLGVMSLDEIHSGFNFYGIPDMATRYFGMRADKLRARLAARGKGVWGGGTEGAQNLPRSVQERLRRVEDLPLQYELVGERMMEGLSREVVTLRPDDLQYKKAAQATAQSYLRNPAFRAYLRGRDAFKEWILSTDGQSWLYGIKVDYIDGAGRKASRPLANWEEAWEMANSVWEHYFKAEAQKAGMDLPKWEEAWRSVAQKYDTDTSGRFYALDSWALPGLGTVEGLQTVYPGSSPIWATIAQGFQKGAADPALARQGLFTDMTRIVETERLTSLFEDQGLRVLSDYELLDTLRTRGIDTEVLNPLDSPALDQALFKEGLVTRGYIARMAERKALETADMLTYSNELGSQAGRRGRAVFRFGQAYADMFGRWGRMLGSRAIARPWLDRIGLRGLMQKMLDYTPFNPKVAASLSRWASRDLTISGGLVGEQETDLDLSPITFLPTLGGGAATLIPGFGVAPLLIIDKLVDALGPDPTTDPLAYQTMIDTIAQVVPAMNFHGRPWYSRLTGSGNIGFFLNATTAYARGIIHNPNFQGWRFTGDIRSELLHSRQVNVVFSDPEFISDLLAAGDPDAVELLIVDGLMQADSQAASSTLFQTFGSWGIPVSGALDTNMDQLYQPWITAGRKFGQFFDLTLPNDDLLRGDQQLLLRTGDDIRRQFFNLEPWQRTLILATTPELAANMVQVWEWGPSAPDNLPGRDIPYRTIGSAPDDPSLSAALDRHSLYVNRGWVIPRDSYLKPYDILGTYISSRQDTTEDAYTEVASYMNDIRWDFLVSDDTKKLLTALVSDSRLQALQITDPKELWAKWSSQRDRMRETIAVALGMDPTDEETMEAINNIIKVPEAEEAWSTEWRGDNIENWSNRALEAPAFFTDKSRTILDAIGVEYEEGMTGLDLINGLIDYRFEHRAVWNAVRLNYQGWIEDRGRPFATGMAALNELVPNPNLTPEYRAQVADFIEWADRQVELADGRHPTRAIQDEVVDRFNRLRTAGRDAPINWDQVWHHAFRGTFGPLNWEPPTPLSPFEEDGSVRSAAYQPFIRDVVDGDTLLVSNKQGPSLIGGPLPLFTVGSGETRYHTVRLLGVMAPEYGKEGGEAATDRLQDALDEARRNGTPVYLVRDKAYARSNVDPFGRELAWLWIGESPYFFPDELRRTD